MTTRVYLSRLDTLGARRGARDVSCDVTAYIALRTAETWPFVDASPREEASRGTVILTVTLDAGATLPKGSVASVAGYAAVRWRTSQAVTNGGGAPADFDVPAEAEQPGPVYGPAGTITDPVSVVSGWTAVTNAADATVGRMPRPWSQNLPGESPRNGIPAAEPPPGEVFGFYEYRDRKSARAKALYSRLAPRSGLPQSEASAWEFEVRWYIDTFTSRRESGTWIDSPPNAPVTAPRRHTTTSGPGGWVRLGETFRCAWFVPMVVREAGNCPIGAAVWIDPQDIDGELQGAGRGWVPAVVTGYGDEVRINGEELPTTLRAARIPVEQLPPRAAALVRADDAVDRGLTAELLETGTGACAFTFRGDDVRDVVLFETVLSIPTIADIAPTDDLPRWTSTRAVVLVELDPARAPGVFTAR